MDSVVKNTSREQLFRTYTLLVALSLLQSFSLPVFSLSPTISLSLRLNTLYVSHSLSITLNSFILFLTSFLYTHV